MTVTPTYPGVYIEEVPSGVKTIASVPTAIAAFVGFTARGPDNRATRVLSFADYDRIFGGLHSRSELSYGVRHFFDNGGGQAYVVRVPGPNDVAASVTLLDGVAAGKEALRIDAQSKGEWANDIIVDVDHDVPAADPNEFNLTITDITTGAVEPFPNVTLDSGKQNFVENVVNDPFSGSKMVTVIVPDANAGRPVQTGTVSGDIDVTNFKNDKDYSLKVSVDLPVIANVPVPFINTGETIPQSVPGLARLLEKRLTIALQVPAPGASVRCTVVNGKRIRVTALFPDNFDSVLTFSAGAANSVLGTLNLGAAAVENVSHGWLGGKRVATLAVKKATNGSDDLSALPLENDLVGKEAQFTGIYALLKTDLFNILCIPDATRVPLGTETAVDQAVVYDAALTLCERRRAFLLVDPDPGIDTVDEAADWKAQLTLRSRNAAVYFPRLLMPDLLNGSRLRAFAPSPVVAGLYARTDADRGVWKAPAGSDVTLRDVRALVYTMSDEENGVLNPLAVNCFRSFPIYGIVSWGARTLVGTDQEGSEWKYVPVRRTALMLEESLFRGTKWVVFEPNDESLWAQVRLNVGAFLQSLFRLGAFQGRSPREAYYVKCDHDTTTQDDINKGIVNIEVGFAPLKPAEFVIIRIKQIPGQIQV